MKKLTKIQPNEQTPEAYCFYCPGCKDHHVYVVQSKQGYCWKFNGDQEKPTFTPSLLNRSGFVDGVAKEICHLFVKDGRIEYCGDCTHELAGKTVDMEECKI